MSQKRWHEQLTTEILENRYSPEILQQIEVLLLQALSMTIRLLAKGDADQIDARLHDVNARLIERMSDAEALIRAIADAVNKKKDPNAP
jgi:hypothetical protein